MLVFAASIKARVMLLLDYRYHRLRVKNPNPQETTVVYKSSIKRVIRRNNRLHKGAKWSNLPGHWERFRIARNKCNNLVYNAK
jgi:hypothetical protein